MGRGGGQFGGSRDGGPFGRGGRGGGGDGLRMGRMVGDGDLRLIVLALTEKQPRHGYDVIKALEEMTSGSYSPSPGVVYPTLTFLEEGGFVTSASEGNKKVYSITDAGIAHLTAHRALSDAIIAKLTFIGRRIADARGWFDREDEGRGATRGDRDIEGVVSELNAARRALKAAIAAVIGESEDEQRRVADILMRAAAEARVNKAGAVDL